MNRHEILIDNRESRNVEINMAVVWLARLSQSVLSVRDGLASQANMAKNYRLQAAH